MTVTAIATPDPDDEFGGIDEVLFERRMNVLSLRNGGMTFRQIGDHFKIDANTARRDEAWAKRYIGGADIESIINNQRAIIVDIRRANYRAMLDGDKDSAATILKGLDHEAKLLGLYAPVRVTTGPTTTDFSERAAQLIQTIAPDTLKELLRGTSADPYRQKLGQDDQTPLDAEVVPDDQPRGGAQPGVSYPFGVPATGVEPPGGHDGPAGPGNGQSAEPGQSVLQPQPPAGDGRGDGSADPDDDDDGWSNIGGPDYVG